MKKLQSNSSILLEDSGKEKLQDFSANITRETKENMEKILTPKEIERKFLVDILPENLDKYPFKRIVQ
jgi:subtilase family serine protease